MKIFKKIILLLMSLVLLIPVLSSCINGDVTDQTGDTTEIPQEVITFIVENGVSDYQIVFPENPTQAVISAAQKLRNEIKEKTGIELKMHDDFISKYKEHDETTKEILIGRTNYKQTSEALSNLNGKDYIITKIGNKIIIAGTNENTTSKAVNYYVNNLIKKNVQRNAEDKTSLIFESYTFYGEYSVESFTVGGVNMNEFTIVYAENTNGAKEAADSLKEKISEACGINLNVVSDTTAPTQHEILIGNPNRTAQQNFNQTKSCKGMEYKIAESSGHLIIASGGSYSLKSAVNKMSTKYLNSGLKRITIASNELTEETLLNTSVSPRATGTDLRVMTANIMAEMPNWSPPGTPPISQRMEIFQAVLDVYSPDVAGIQEISANWSQAIFDSVGDEYEFIYRKTPDGLDNYSTIIYKKSKFTVIDKGLTYFTPNGKNVIRLVTWVLLEDNTTKQRFGFFNTHWTPHSDSEKQIHANEHANIIKAFLNKYNVPVFSTGDYNAVHDTSVFTGFLSNAGLLDATEVARQSGTLINDLGGCGTPGVPHTTSMNRIDHIVISKNVSVLGFETVVENDTFIISDHSPKYADIKFN